MKLYLYGTRFRPPMPGTVPRENLVIVKDFGDRIEFCGHSVWGYAAYSAPLDKKQKADYELVFCETRNV